MGISVASCSSIAKQSLCYFCMGLILVICLETAHVPKIVSEGC